MIKVLREWPSRLLKIKIKINEKRRNNFKNDQEGNFPLFMNAKLQTTPKLKTVRSHNPTIKSQF